MSKRVLSVISALACIITAFAAGTTKYEVKVGAFSELRVTNSINVIYRQSADSAGVAVFECRPDLVSSLILNLSDSKLTVQLSPEAAGRTDLPTITVYSRFLTKAFNSGDSTLRVLSVAPGPQFEASLEGNGLLTVSNIQSTRVKGSVRFGHGTLSLEGVCESAQFATAGAGTIEAGDLECSEVSVKAIGTGSVNVWATGKLSVYGTGSTTVNYRGTPEIKKSAIGLKINPIQ